MLDKIKDINAKRLPLSPLFFIVDNEIDDRVIDAKSKGIVEFIKNDENNNAKGIGKGTKLDKINEIKRKIMGKMLKTKPQIANLLHFFFSSTIINLSN